MAMSPAKAEDSKQHRLDALKRIHLRDFRAFFQGIHYAAFSIDDQTVVIARRDLWSVEFTGAEAITLRGILSEISSAFSGDAFIETILAASPKPWMRPEDCRRGPTPDLGWLMTY